MDNIAPALKVFVIAGGIVLLAGAVLLVALIVMRASEDPDPPAAGPRGESAAPAAEVGAAQPRLCEVAAPTSGPLPEPLSVPLPAGARIEQAVPGGGCLILLGVDGAGRQFVALVNPLTGERISLLLLRPAE